MLRLLCALGVSIGLAAATTGCSDDTTTSPTPTTPDPVTVVFNGTLNPNAGATHRFTTQASGDVTATLTTVAPDTAVAMGLSLGTWNGNSCAIIIAKDTAVQGSAVIGRASGIGELCVRVYDTGSIVEETSYEVTVVHP